MLNLKKEINRCKFEALRVKMDIGSGSGKVSDLRKLKKQIAELNRRLSVENA